ncbi:MAG: RrF2 family transcriptional regulator [Candidatus Methanomethylophilaceae archaeon]|nr:RrF2 family transcriptional regulator [Candidatus Methanomethylophilaceae archaeon]MBR4216468.1 RrF2 family transcriptional regulator [Candidatus Methanomethylophilaceae archaeon]MBR6871146.1 RrF2 family transcriptional regulator [Candidatus Methanomethylophilaceae archaeon]
MGYLVSTKGRYALRMILDLAENSTGSYVPLKEIAERQNISLKYMEAIMPNLVKAGLVSAIQGKGGGYILSKNIGEYTVGEVLKASEGSMVPVACLEGGFECPRSSICKTRKVWEKLDLMIDGYLDNLPLSDLLEDDMTGCSRS